MSQVCLKLLDKGQFRFLLNIVWRGPYYEDVGIDQKECALSMNMEYPVF